MQVTTRDEGGRVIDEVSKVYDNNDPQNVVVVIERGIQKNTQYSATIHIITAAVNSASLELNFGKH